MSARANIIERMREGPVLFDGAMGTVIYDRGVFINTCYDELNLTNSQLIHRIHEDYVAAGAQVIETNTFGANAIKLRSFGLAEQVEQINRAGVRLARQAAGPSVYVAGSVGPCTEPNQLILDDQAAMEVESAVGRQVSALADEGADLVILETFWDLRELQIAARAARPWGLPVLASVAAEAPGRTVKGLSVEQAFEALERDDNVDAVGLNCGMGPADMFEALRRVIHLTHKPVVVMPNSGLPRTVGGRRLYLSNPEYFTEYAKRFVALGARGIGGCCGTTPEHIRMAGRAIRSLPGVHKHVEIPPAPARRPSAEAIPPAQRSSLAAKMLSGRKVAMVEVLPPRSGPLDKMIQKCLRCRQAGVDAINVPDGPRASARISPMITALIIERQAGVETVLHYCCRDRNLIGMQSDLLGAYAAGLRNILIITGDPPKLGNYPDATGVFDVDSIGLTRVAEGLNRGLDAGGNELDTPTGLFIGVGVNPVAVDLDTEMQRFFRKIEAGAQYAITQPVFNVEALLHFLDRAGRHPRRIPVVAGIWPLISYRNAEFMNNEVPGVCVPADILERMRRCRTKQESLAEGVAIARDTIHRLADHVAGFQVSAPLGDVDTALAVLGM